MNRITLSGELVERKVLRRTPAGIPVSEGRLHHAGEQLEAGVLRQVALEMALVAIGDSARWLEAVPVGGKIRVEGFLTARSRNSRSPVLHINTLEYLEGN